MDKKQESSERKFTFRKKKSQTNNQKNVKLNKKTANNFSNELKNVNKYKPETQYSRNEYEKLIRRNIRGSYHEISEIALSHVEDYVRNYHFAIRDLDFIRSKLDTKTLEEVLYKMMDGFWNLHDMQCNAIVKSYRIVTGEKLETAIKNFIKEKYPEAKDFAYYFKAAFSKLVEKELHLMMPDLEDEAKTIYYQSIFENEDYIRIEHRIFEEQQAFQNMILDHIPERMPELYPMARRMKRHFILHVGPTNSGKTYQALQALKEAEKGIYLAPLRLLAYEIYDRLNGENVLCNMITGEEEIIHDGANHYSATIETLNIQEFYDVAVIDEGQMISEKRRGGAWTRAILGVCAPRVHICSDSSCISLIKKIIDECGDSYEIVHNERMVPLKMDERHFEFPKDVQEKDALIVFSKKSVIAVTAELQQNGIQASMIYGNLPYDVRMNEVRRFVSGETKVVVATDAIGMGLNLPIKRIVFLETKKFDGDVVRPLTVSEIKQIAGRAGRRGLFEIGLYNSEYRRNSIRKAVEAELEDLQTAKLGIPESIIALDMPLTDILTRWSEIQNEDLYEKADLSEDIELCRYLEKFVKDKNILYDMITLGIRSSKKSMSDILVKLAMIEETVEDNKELYIDQVIDENVVQYAEELEKMNMEQLEELYLVYDLLYAYLRKFRHVKRMNEIIRHKRECSAKIIELLKTQKLETRKCKFCGCDLSWNYPYSSCLDCYVGR